MKLNNKEPNFQINIGDNPIIKLKKEERIRLINLVLSAASRKEFPTEGSPEEKRNSFKEFESLLLSASRLKKPFLELLSPPVNQDNGKRIIPSISKILLARYLEAAIDYSQIKDKNQLDKEISELRGKNRQDIDLELIGDPRTVERRSKEREVASTISQPKDHSIKTQESQPSKENKSLRRLLSFSIKLLDESLQEIPNLDQKLKANGLQLHPNQANAIYHSPLIDDRNKIHAILNQDGLNKVKTNLESLLNKVKSSSQNLNEREKIFLSNFQIQNTRDLYHQIFRQKILSSAVFMQKLKTLLSLGD